MSAGKRLAEGDLGIVFSSVQATLAELGAASPSGSRHFAKQTFTKDQKGSPALIRAFLELPPGMQRRFMRDVMKHYENSWRLKQTYPLFVQWMKAPRLECLEFMDFLKRFANDQQPRGDDDRP